jgi:chorismate dehydratase
VFAMWVAREDAGTEGVEEALSRARDRGLANVDAIVREDGVRLGLTEEVGRHYLTKNLHYHLSSAERTGLRLFRELAAQQNLVNPDVDLVFRDLVTA